MPTDPRLLNRKEVEQLAEKLRGEIKGARTAITAKGPSPAGLAILASYGKVAEELKDKKLLTEAAFEALCMETLHNEVQARHITVPEIYLAEVYRDFIKPDFLNIAHKARQTNIPGNFSRN